MSGYQALRVSKHEESRGRSRERGDSLGDPNDLPVVLARVADFRSPVDKPEVDLELAFDDPPLDFEPDATETAPPDRSRLAVAAFVLVAGLIGFGLGRVTCPATVADADPGLAATAAFTPPTWERQTWTAPEPRVISSETNAIASEPTSQPTFQPGPIVTPTEQTPPSSDPSWTPTPITTPPAEANRAGDRPMLVPAEPGDSEPPWFGSSGPSEKPADAAGRSTWIANQSMSLSTGPNGSRPEPRPAGQDPYSAARVALRQTAASQAGVPPCAPNDTPPTSRPFVGSALPDGPNPVPVAEPGGYQPAPSNGPLSAGSRGVPVLSQGISSNNYPTTPYPTTSPRSAIENSVQVTR
ncbi:MAG TPA: hypothetical protein VJL29_13965 [Thermoguttaceae bacterium]|nr:hypothetical protein [Thermoguttaceae bacterium]